MVGLLKKMLVCGAKGLRSSALAEAEAEAAPKAKEGHVRVCVGRCISRSERFEMEANYLNHSLFEGLLEMSVEEFGYSYDGALRIACEVELFLYLLGLLRSSDPAVHYMELPDLIAKFYGSAAATPSPTRSH